MAALGLGRDAQEGGGVTAGWLGWGATGGAMKLMAGRGMGLAGAGVAAGAASASLAE